MTRRRPEIISAVLAALALVVGGACGTAYVAPTPSPVPTSTSTPTATPSPTPAPAVTHDVVYFARDRLPPVGAHVAGAGSGATAEERIRSRLDALFTAAAPAGLFNVAPTVKARPASVVVGAPFTVVDFTVPNDDWGAAGSAGTRAFIQQLVYTITEEPGVDLVLITQNGGQIAIVGGEGVVIDHPSGRHHVAGYSVAASLERVRSFDGDVVPVTPTATVTSRYSVDEVAPALARLVVELTRPGDDQHWLPTFDVSPVAATVGGKNELQLTVYDGTEAASDIIIDRSPLRRLKIESGLESRSTVYRLALDDLRPWRVGVTFDPVRIVLDVGGDPDAVNANVAIYRPRFAEPLGASAVVNGMVRAFEATYEYRLTDVFGGPLTGGYGMASFGTSPIWGLFEFRLSSIPAGTSNVEVFLRSPRDGEISDLARVAVVVAP
ncbi:MAG: Gmad2 immunoglobulin-like domain-containing protein [Chloroflexota bacterium]